jgi:hypothetical protein
VLDSTQVEPDVPAQTVGGQASSDSARWLAGVLRGRTFQRRDHHSDFRSSWTCRHTEGGNGLVLNRRPELVNEPPGLHINPLLCICISTRRTVDRLNKS